MKKLILIALVIANCLPSMAQDSTLIGLSLAYLRDRWYNDAEYLTKSVSDLGGKLLLEYANGDAETQIKQIESLIDRGVKVLIIVASDAEALNNSVDICKNANIKVIAYDRLIKNCDIDYYVSFDAEKVGELQAEYITKLKPKGNYVLIAGPTKDNNAVNFLKGQKKVLKPFVNNNSIKILYENNMNEWDKMESFVETSSVIETGEQIDAVIASNDDLAAGAIMAFEGDDRFTETLITGQDATLEACQNLLSGKQTMTIYKSIKLLAKTTAKLALSLTDGSKIEGINSEIDNGAKKVPSILLEPVVVDKTNLKETVIKDGFHSNQDIYGE
ncbi:MAG: substrate-binding domain-containing protein [Salinivirgaceae bacterium]|jgi:D-xylose transport system substrate-binding protein|nr:substrate-binding domain-containing protein [Salinivirgaceae bacterium]